ncbi:hypothetical protein CDAR_171311 [Caerostris darwini]|uniref:Uncharacterized protein n=1 Tax=Caerostris darwini TaxID=1538125 RepID=A0AAV4WP30_9ARAC|nr:hypothetical protein CDAR_171311 [Caerostris darwini]
MQDRRRPSVQRTASQRRGQVRRHPSHVLGGHFRSIGHRRVSVLRQTHLFIRGPSVFTNDVGRPADWQPPGLIDRPSCQAKRLTRWSKAARSLPNYRCLCGG